MKSERNALVKASDPRQCHGAHTSVDDVWRGLTRRLIKKKIGASLYIIVKTDDKKLDPSPMPRNRPFFRFDIDWSTNPTITPRIQNESRWLEAPTHTSITVLTLWSVIWGVGGPGGYWNGSRCVENRRHKLSIPLFWHTTEIFERPVVRVLSAIHCDCKIAGVNCPVLFYTYLPS